MIDDFDDPALRELAELHRMEYVPSSLIDTSPGLAGFIPEAIARGRGVVSQGVEADGRLRVLLSDPGDFETMDVLRSGLAFDFWISLASRPAIRAAIASIYGVPPGL